MAGEFVVIADEGGWRQYWGVLRAALVDIEAPQPPCQYPCSIAVRQEGKKFHCCYVYLNDAIQLLQAQQKTYLHEMQECSRQPQQSGPVDPLDAGRSQADLNRGQAHFNRDMSAGITALVWLLIGKSETFTKSDYDKAVGDAKRMYDEREATLKGPEHE